MRRISAAKIFSSLVIFSFALAPTLVSAQGGDVVPESGMAAMVRVEVAPGLIVVEGLVQQNRAEEREISQLLRDGQQAINGFDVGDGVLVDGQIIASARRHCSSVADRHQFVETGNGTIALYTSDGQMLDAPWGMGGGALHNEFWLDGPPPLNEVPPGHAGVWNLSAPDVIARPDHPRGFDHLSAPDVIAMGKPDEVSCVADIVGDGVGGDFVPREVRWGWTDSGAFIHLDFTTGLATIDHGPGPADP